MSIHWFELVRCAVALHLDVLPDDIDADARLLEDLGLDALDVVLVVLRLEDVAHCELPIAALERVSTVADLARMLVPTAPARRAASGW